MPYETIRRNHLYIMRKIGQPKALSDDEEMLLVQIIVLVSESGFPIDRNDLQMLVKSYLDYKGEISRFVDNKPGKDWMRSFEKRHPEISRKKPELLTKARAEGLSHSVISTFFEMYRSILENNGLLQQPHRIFNLDETGLNTDPRSAKVYAKKASKNTYLKSASCGKTSYTVLFCCSAAGKFLPPFVVFKGINLYDTWTTGGPKNAIYGVTPSGWMQSNVFESWLTSFSKHIEALEKPCLLIMDGHGSHITYNCAEICKSNGIILLCIPPNTSHALQPLDVGVFGPMRSNWREILKTWFRETRLQNVSKPVFPSLLTKLVEKINPQWAIGGFRGSGLFPVNEEIVKKRAVDRPNPDSNSSLGPVSLEHFQKAIVDVITPMSSPETCSAKKNSSRSRKRVQAKTREILTSVESMDRLKNEMIGRKKKKTAKRKIMIVHESSSESELDSALVVDDEAEDEDEPCCSLSDFTTKEKHKLKGVTVNYGEVNTLDWLIVQYGERKFLGQVEEIVLTDVYRMNFVRYQPTKEPKGCVFAFPQNRDMESISKKEVVGKVQPPIPSRRGELVFELNAHLW
ncbi:uncharacterized protein LOC144422763 [Styela clava]